jgi:hypothetical protein
MSTLLDLIKARRLELEAAEASARSSTYTDSMRVRALLAFIDEARADPNAHRELREQVLALADRSSDPSFKQWTEAQLAAPPPARAIRDELPREQPATRVRGRQGADEPRPVEQVAEPMTPDEVRAQLVRSTYRGEPYMVADNIKPAYPVTHWWQREPGDWLKG